MMRETPGRGGMHVVVAEGDVVGGERFAVVPGDVVAKVDLPGRGIDPNFGKRDLITCLKVACRVSLRPGRIGIVPRRTVVCGVYADKSSDEEHAVAPVRRSGWSLRVVR